MYAFVSNEHMCIVTSRRRLEFLCSVYSYPQFKKVETEQEANKFITQTQRKFIDNGFRKYGRKIGENYISVKYFIDKPNLYINVDTTHIGHLRLKVDEDVVKQDSRYDLLKLKVLDINLRDEFIADHCLAISYMLTLLPRFLSMDIELPDESVFLSIMKYSGRNPSIKRIRSEVFEREGDVFYTLK